MHEIVRVLCDVGLAPKSSIPRCFLCDSLLAHRYNRPQGSEPALEDISTLMSRFVIKVARKAEAPKTVTSTNLPYGLPSFRGRGRITSAQMRCVQDGKVANAGGKIFVVKNLRLTGS
jgi:hypothetical protein